MSEDRSLLAEWLERTARMLAGQAGEVEVRETATRALRLFEVDVAEEDLSAVAGGKKAATWGAMQALAEHAAWASGDPRRVRVELVAH